jgi:hypothetical protein
VRCHRAPSTALPVAEYRGSEVQIPLSSEQSYKTAAPIQLAILKDQDRPFGAVVGVLGSVLQLIEEGATHLEVTTDQCHRILFRNELWTWYIKRTYTQRTGSLAKMNGYPGRFFDRKHFSLFETASLISCAKSSGGANMRLQNTRGCWSDFDGGLREDPLQR